MPSYISHAIMGSETYKQIQKSENVFQIPIDENEFKGYCLGADLSYSSKKLKKDPHNALTQSFFLNMIKYIKDNKLIEDSNLLALLYGHIAHYFFDVNIHPLIFYIESGSKQVGFIPNHHLIEGYIDSYLSKKILNQDIMDIKSNYFNKIKLSSLKVQRLLNNIYGKVYNDYTIINAYKKILFLFSALEDFVKNGSISKKMLIKYSKFREFMDVNKLTYNDLTNKSKEYFTNPVTGEKHNESFMELYNKSIEMSIDAFKKVNNFLYSTSTLSSLEKVFLDLSYDTGVSCSLGKKMIYTKNSKLSKKQISLK